MMPRQRPQLTELAVSRARPRKARYTIIDGPGGVPGFMLVVQPSGAKSFSIRVRIGAEQPRLACGKHPVVGLAEARARARAMLQQIEKGDDPRGARSAQQEAQKPKDGFATVVETYTRKRLQPRLRRWQDVAATLHRDAVPAWADRPIGTISKRDVRDLLDDVAARAPVSANRLRSHLHALWKWAVRNDYCPSNVVEGVDKPTHEVARDRLISEDELRAIWAVWLTMGYPFGHVGRLLLLSGARRSEWAGASWSEIDLRDATWTLPAARAKTGREHIVPLSPQILAVLAELPRIAGPNDLLFPSARVARVNPVSGFSKALRVTHELSSTSAWTWHDLRRAARTGLAKLGVTAAVGERILNHADGTASRVAEVYNRHSYLPEMRTALVMWGAEVERITRDEAAVVVALRRP